MSESNGYATREALLSAPMPRRFKDIELNGHKFRLRSLTPSESNPWAVKSGTDKGLVTAGARIIVLCVVNGEGQRIFSDNDVAQIMEMDAAFVAALARECQEHAGIVDAVALEEAEKN